MGVSQSLCRHLLMSDWRYPWAAKGDVKAFFGLMLDNVANLLLTVSLLSVVFEFPTNIALRYMSATALPGLRRRYRRLAAVAGPIG